MAPLLLSHHLGSSSKPGSTAPVGVGWESEDPILKLNFVPPEGQSLECRKLYKTLYSGNLKFWGSHLVSPWEFLKNMNFQTSLPGFDSGGLAGICIFNKQVLYRIPLGLKFEKNTAELEREGGKSWIQKLWCWMVNKWTEILWIIITCIL